MRRILSSIIVSVLVLVVAVPVFASSCPKLIAQIQTEASKRFDKNAAEAKVKAAEADRLHKEGKHAESEKAAKEGLELLGIKS